jgi:signal transduction histidine kinase
VLLSYLDSDKNQYAFKMEGLDKDWNYVGSQRRATYTNLDAKEYLFRVKAADKNGVWNERGALIKIIIHPAWYNTWWFRILFVSTLIGSCLLYYRARINSIEKQKEVLEVLVLERTTELVQKKEEIETQKNSIEEKNSNLLEAQYIIEEQNEELKAINNDLESRVEQRTRELKNVNTELLASNHELDMFIYRASHDIRGPIATILGLCKVAQMDIQDPTALMYIEMLNQNSEQTNQRLLRILSIYDFRNAGISPRLVHLHPFILSIIDSLKFTKGFEQVRFEFDYAIHLDIDVITDSVLLHTVLYNLIENAIKYRKQSVDSYIRITISTDDSDHLFIRIADNGIGIPKELQSKLFTMFFRGTLENSGIGLGLYIAKIITDKLSGTIILQDKQIGETVFEIQLPMRLMSNTFETSYQKEEDLR